MLLDFIPVIGRFLPGMSLSHGVVLSAGGSVNDLGVQILVAVAISAAVLWIAALVIRRREG